MKWSGKFSDIKCAARVLATGTFEDAISLNEKNAITVVWLEQRVLRMKRASLVVTIVAFSWNS
jgi:hypothetical protein